MQIAFSVRFQPGFHADIERCKARPQTNVKKCLQNRFPDNGLTVRIKVVLREIAMVKLQIAGLKEEFAGLKMSPFGGLVFGAAFSAERKNMSPFRGLFLGPRGGPTKNGAADL